MKPNCTIIQFPTPRRDAAPTKPRTPPVRQKNSVYRNREYLTEDEVSKLIQVAGEVGRHGHRDATLIMIAFRHGLRVTELVRLRWDQVDLHQGLMHINRIKRGTPSVHPLHGPEIIALHKLQEIGSGLSHVFISERGAPLTPDAVRKIISRAGREAKLPFKVHPHMLRHACGYKLAQAGQDTRAIQHYLGHTNIQHTVRYTHLSSERFRSFWSD